MINRRTDSFPRRTRVHLLLIPVVAVALGGPPSAAAGDAVRLRYGLRSGVTYDGAMTSSMTITMTMEGLPEDAAAMIGAIGKDLRQEISVRTTLAAGGVGKDGSLPLEYRVVEGKLTMKVAGQPIDIPGASDAFPSAAWPGRISAERLRLEVDSKALGRMQGLSVDLADRLAQAMPPLPDRELKIGDSFEIPVKIPLPGVPMAGRVDSVSKTVYTLRGITSDDAVFDLKMIVSGSGTKGASREGEGAKLAIIVAGEGSGSAVFDLREGIFTEMKAEMKVEMTVETPFPSGPDPLPEGGSPAQKIVRIHASMSGPAEYHLSPAPAIRK